MKTAVSAYCWEKTHRDSHRESVQQSLLQTLLNPVLCSFKHSLAKYICAVKYIATNTYAVRPASILRPCFSDPELMLHLVTKSNSSFLMIKEAFSHYLDFPSDPAGEVCIQDACRQPFSSAPPQIIMYFVFLLLSDVQNTILKYQSDVCPVLWAVRLWHEKHQNS